MSVKCRACGADTEVIETRDHASRAVTRRRRACVSVECGARGSTLEFWADRVSAAPEPAISPQAPAKASGGLIGLDEW